MGKFISKNVQGIVYYDIFSKSTFEEILALNKFMTLYSFEKEGKSKTVEIYYDTPARLLERAGITLCKILEKDKSYFQVERESHIPKDSLIKVRETKVFVHEIGANERIEEHMYYLIDGITSMFSTQFNIDLENVLKTVIPMIEITSIAKTYKAFSGSGFKCQMDFENVSYKNFQTKRTACNLMMKVQLKSSYAYMDSFNDFTSKLEKYCKKIIPLKDSKYQIAGRMTKSK